ncbi:MAG: hypothetical protein VX079_05845, partial [Pseudomonadota bacterium]|nr:hypothetical protein [Pseudomonadota bacterium]
ACLRGCNPCAAKKGCNTCVAKRGCNPCAAKRGCVAFNPCVARRGRNPCGGCNPYGGAPEVEVLIAEAASTYDCLIDKMKAAHSKSKNPSAKNYTRFRLLSKVAYKSATHDNSLVQTCSNHYAKNYSAYEKAGTFKLGALLAKR